MRYVALLRGINVGGNNIIPMTRLKAAFEAMGFDDVSTYIQSGNVLFSAKSEPAARLEARIEKALGATFHYDATVLVRSKAQMQDVVRGAPSDWPEPTQRCNVIFIKPPLTPAAALKATTPKPGIDAVAQGKGVLYFATVLTQRTQSGLPKFVATREYKGVTIRTFGTVTKILERL